MLGSWVLALSCLFLGVFADSPVSVPGDLSEEDKQSVDSILGLLSCLDDPDCLQPLPIVDPITPTEKAIRFKIENYDPSISQEEYLALFQQHMLQGLVIKFYPDEVKPSDTSMPKPPSPYFTLCEKIHLKLEELEHQHPELKILKLELLERFNKYSSQFKGGFKAGENVVVKVLEMLLVVVDQLKKDFDVKKPHPVVIDEGKEVVEIIAEVDEAPFIGSVRGIPGVNYPNYTEVPITSFSCQDKHIPGFYADLETGCQVFHVCYEHRRESFLCPLGTIFNQPILACDYWYSSNCSLAPNYFEKYEKPDPKPYSTTEGPFTKKPVTKEPVEIIDKITDLKTLVPFIPVTAKVVEYPKKPEGKPIVSIISGIEEVAAKIFGEVIAKKLAALKVKVPVKAPVDQVTDKVFEGVVTTGLKVASKARKVIKTLPKPVPGFVKVVKPHPVAKTAAIKAKFAAKAAVPVAKSILAAAKIPVVKAAAAAAVKVPIVKAKAAGAAAAAVKVPIVKAKVAGAAAAAIKVPFLKGKVAGAAAAAVKVPVMKAKVAGAAAGAVKVPFVKAKLAGAAKLPIVKAKFATTAVKVPVAKAKLFKSAAVPFFKMQAASHVPVLKAKKVVKMAPLVKMAALPVVKAKLVGSSAIAPLTKKALALGYMKLLKAKKFAVMG